MKIITKILSNRIRPLLNKIISCDQHAFIEGRSIFDSTIICNEVIHSFKAKKGKKGWMALKIDFDKAYDRVSWPFVAKILNCVGFDGKVVSLIMKCINTVSFQVLINGAPSMDFYPTNSYNFV